jgi:hypothetical protein
MARYNFGASVADYVITAGSVVSGGRTAVLRGGVNVWFYTTRTAGSRYTDLLLGGLPVTEIPSVNTGDDTGYLPEFQGPDEVSFMWADANGGSGPRHLIRTTETPSYITHNQSISGVKTFTASPTVPTPTLGTQVANKDYADSIVGGATPDATTTVKGKVKLAGDLSGTADLPTVPGLAAKADTASVVTLAGTQTITGTKTFSAQVTVPLTPVAATDSASKDYVDTIGSAGTPDATTTVKGKVKLAGDLSGTADLPTVPGLATKADDAGVVHLAGPETITGEKTFTDAVVINQPNLLQSALSINQPNVSGSTGDADIAQLAYLGVVKAWFNEIGAFRLERSGSETILRVFGNGNVTNNILEFVAGDKGTPGATYARMGALGAFYHANNDYTAWTSITIDSLTTASKYTAQPNGTDNWNAPQVRVTNGGKTAELRGRINVANIAGVSDESIASAMPTSMAYLGMTANTASSVPSRNRGFTGYITGAGGQRLRVTSAGVLQATGSVTGSSSTFISLDGLTYSLET